MNVLNNFSVLPAWLWMAMGVFALAGIVKGVVGLGLPTVAMGLLALRLPPAEAAALLIIPSLVTNIWQMRPWRALGLSVARMWPMQAGIVVGTAAGAWLIGAPAGAWAHVALGVALVAYAGWALLGARWHVPPERERWMGPVVGAVTGGVTAGTGVFVVPAVPYLQALDIHRDELIQTMGLCFTVSTVALAAGLAWNGSFTAGDVGWSAVLLLPALAGMRAGAWLRSRLSALWFRRCLMVSLALLGVSMIMR